MTYVADASVNQAKHDVGFHEGGNNSNPYSEWQYGNRHNPWCNSFVAFCACVGGFRFWPWSTYGQKGDAYVPYQKNHAIQAGAWRDKWWRAAPGDFVCFDWEHNGVLDHIEMVIADDGNKIVTIGGNTSNGVYYRTRDRSYVGGFVALSEAGQSGPPPPPPPPPEVVDVITGPCPGIPDDKDGNKAYWEFCPKGKRPDIPNGGVLLHNNGRIAHDEPVPDHPSAHVWRPAPRAGGTKWVTGYGRADNHGVVLVDDKGNTTTALQGLFP